MGWPRINMIGDRYGRLVVLQEISQNIVEAVCDCGVTKKFQKSHLRQGATKSCGCLHKERASESHKTHGMAGTPIYKIWESMRRRCTNEKSDRFKSYGGRGVKVCDAWIKSFDAFYKDMGDRPSPEYTLDRIDVNGDYTPENCRWATRKQQANNKTNNMMLEWFGKKLSATVIHSESGSTVSCKTFRRRINDGWDLPRALWNSVAYKSTGKVMI